jgi:chromate transport protein ChrA
MYAAERVFAAAPPLYVVALLIQLWWIPVRFLKMGWDVTEQYNTDVSRAMSMVAMVLLVGASWELVQRSRSRVRFGMALTFATNLVALALEMFRFYAVAPDRHAILHFYNSLQWVYVVVDVLGVTGIAVAAGRQTLGTSLVVIALTASLATPARDAIRDLVGWSFSYWFHVAAVSLRALFAIIVIGVIAQQCFAPVRDHLQAARRFSLLAWLFAMRAAFACVMLAAARSTSIVQLWLVGLEAVLLLLVAMIVWGIAQNQLPRMPRYSLHVALAGIVLTWTLSANVILLGFGAPHDDGTGSGLESWQLAAAAIANVVLLVSLWHYAKYARAIRRSVIAGTVVVVAATAFELFGPDRVMWVCEVLSCVAVIPAFRATAIALADDPVPTTADVFV